MKLSSVPTLRSIPPPHFLEVLGKMRGNRRTKPFQFPVFLCPPENHDQSTQKSMSFGCLDASVLVLCKAFPKALAHHCSILRVASVFYITLHTQRLSFFMVLVQKSVLLCGSYSPSSFGSAGHISLLSETPFSAALGSVFVLKILIFPPPETECAIRIEEI